MRFDLDVANAAIGRDGLARWIPALALGYFAYLFRALRGKVVLDDEHG